MSEEIDRGILDKIGFIGVGLMGSGMVDRLQNSRLRNTFTSSQKQGTNRQGQ